MQDGPRRIIKTDLAPAPEPASSQAVVSCGIVYMSAQVGKSPNGTLPPEFDMQMKNTMYNARAILESAGSDLNNVLRVSIHISDAYYWERAEKLYAFFFPTQDPPAREMMAVSSLPHGALVQVTITAAVKMSF